MSDTWEPRVIVSETQCSLCKRSPVVARVVRVHELHVCQKCVDDLKLKFVTPVSGGSDAKT